MPRLMVVDDDRDTLDLLTAFFRPRGFTIKTFEEAESALAQYRANPDQWDVILTDLHLPKMDGLELTREINAINSKTPVILITSNRSKNLALKAIQDGAFDFVLKPFHFAQLDVCVQRAMSVNRLKENLDQLRQHVNADLSQRIIGRSPRFLDALNLAKRIAPSLANVVIMGESGTGKEVFAQFIHDNSKRKNGPFVAINCSAIPENLLESELFGHAKGSFTGAFDKKIGLFEEAQDGTLFLDEIGDLSQSLQAKLLRVLQERKIKRVGENIYRSVNCRILSATHKNLIEEVTAGRFREDLFFRLNVIPVYIPPLREREEDLLPLAQGFLKKFAAQYDSPAKHLSAAAKAFILASPWRGNVRELENAVERAVVLATGETVDVIHFRQLDVPTSLPQDNRGTANIAANDWQDTGNKFIVDVGDNLPTVEDVVRQFILFAVNKNEGARDKTAKAIGIDRKTLYRKLQSQGLSYEPRSIS